MNYCKGVKGQIVVWKFNNKKLWLNESKCSGAHKCNSMKTDLVKYKKWWKIFMFIPESNPAYSRSSLDWSDATAQQPGTSKSSTFIRSFSFAKTHQICEWVTMSLGDNTTTLSCHIFGSLLFLLLLLLLLQKIRRAATYIFSWSSLLFRL